MRRTSWTRCIVTTATNHWSVTGFNVIPSLKRRKLFDTLQTRHNFNRQTSSTAHTTLYWQLRFNTGVHTFSRTVVTAVRHHLTDIHLICYHALEWQSMYTYHLTLVPRHPLVNSLVNRWWTWDIGSDTCVNNPFVSHRRPDQTREYLLVSTATCFGKCYLMLI